jgi:hypothetical protein
MSQRVRDVFAWLRLFMSTQGPPATTRLVLFAHSLFMDRVGSHCRVGVRRLADITGLDKTTVAQHRTAAIKLGWLIGSKPPRGQGSGEIFAATPDGVKATDSGTVSSEAGQADAKPRQVSGLTGPTVRNKPTNRPSGPDVPSLPLTPLGKRLEATRNGGPTNICNRHITQANLKDHLRNWMRRDPTVGTCRYALQKAVIRTMFDEPCGKCSIEGKRDPGEIEYWHAILRR